MPAPVSAISRRRSSKPTASRSVIRGSSACSHGQAEPGGSLIRVVIAPLSDPARLSPPAERL
jgi:hypothetical protein